MKKLLPFSLSALILTGCQTIPPGWIQTGQSNPGQIAPWIMAADPGSIKVNGQIATIISVMSFNTPQATDRYKNGYRAILITNEYKCGEYQSRILKQDFYESKEIIVASIKTPTEYKPINPSSAGEKEYNLACAGVRVAPAKAPTQQQKPSVPAQTTSSSNQTSNKNNFLIGMCSVSGYQKGDPPLDSCSKTQLVNRDIWATGGRIFRPNTTVTFYISGAKAIPSSKTEQIFEFPVNYSIISATEIVTTVSAKGGCIVKEKYTKIGSDVFEESLPSSGTCDQSQLRANQDSVKMGRQKTYLIREN